MNIERKQKLIDLGPDTLADALIELALHSETADDMIERLIAEPEDNVKRFKRKLAALKRSKHFIDRRGAAGFARQCAMMLADLKAGVSDPLTGVRLVAAFYETDEAVLGHTDDSDGCVGNIFSFEAQELFIEYASLCADKQTIADIVLELNRTNEYGVRDRLIGCAGKFLPEPVIRSMIPVLRKRADDEKDESGKRIHLMLIESLARQIKDAGLFEKTRIESWGTLSTAAYIDIASVYFESGDLDTAHAWLKKIPPNDTFHAHDRDRLLLEILRKQGNTEELTGLLYRRFRSYRSADTLTELLDVIGHDKKDTVVTEETALILESTGLKESDVAFLISMGKIDEAETYIFDHADKLNGDFYSTLLPLAEMMEAANRNMAASLIYRSVLMSILTRGYIKSYPHGILYLKKLDKLGAAISDWKGFHHHEDFKSRLFQEHGRKYSFWSKYKAKK